MADDSELYEANTHLFVVKIWLEQSADEGRQARWRGHITYVLNGERSYIEDLDGVIAFIEPYLERMGVRRSATRRFCRWFARLIGR